VPEVVWKIATSVHASRYALLPLSPITPDTVIGIAMSASLRQGLVERGVALTHRIVVGDDTVVFRVIEWQRDSSVGAAGDVLLDSKHGHGDKSVSRWPRNVEQFRLAKQDRTCEAEQFGAILHGNRACTPTPPD